MTMEEASKVLGADPAYFGEEGIAEVERQLIKLDGARTTSERMIADEKIRRH